MQGNAPGKRQKRSVAMKSCKEHTITVKNRTITASDWLSWRNQGISSAEIAHILGISPAMARVIARKFRQMGFPDPLYRKRKPGPVYNLDAATDAGAYVLGILWGISTASEDGYLVRHRDRWYVDTVREYLGITARPQRSRSRTDVQWRLKISRAEDVQVLRSILEHYGWTPRKAPERPYPKGQIDDRGFIRAWVELHSCADTTRTGKRRAPAPRLRIYGNRLLLEEINLLISAGANVRPRKLQRTQNETTAALCYTWGNCISVLNWLYAGAELYNPDARERLFSPVLSGRGEES